MLLADNIPDIYFIQKWVHYELQTVFDVDDSKSLLPAIAILGAQVLQDDQFFSSHKDHQSSGR